MNWIKENKFLSGLSGATLLGVILLYFVGSHFTKVYDEAKGAYEIAAGEADRFVKLPLYPNPENKAAKRKAIDEYRRSLESLQTSFEKFRPKEIKNITSQEFTSNLLAAHAETRKAFEEAKTVVPEAYFVGFEGYKANVATANNTGILGYQLDAIKALMLDLAKAKPTELKNLYRPALLEEEGKPFAPGPSDVARALPLEITFTGREDSVRQAVTAFSKIDTRYMVIRSLRISNMKKDPPKATDAKFDKPAAAPGAAGGAPDPFGGGFVLPDDASAAASAPATPAAPAPKAQDSSRILSQVLGDEQLQVFIRLDILQFLPAKKLP